MHMRAPEPWSAEQPHATVVRAGWFTWEVRLSNGGMTMSPSPIVWGSRERAERRARTILAKWIAPPKERDRFTVTI